MPSVSVTFLGFTIKQAKKHTSTWRFNSSMRLTMTCHRKLAERRFAKKVWRMEMETRLYVYTGTGNSLWAGRLLAQALGEASVEFMPCPSGNFPVKADRVGLIFPVHIWGLPIRVIRFIEHLQIDPGTRFFALAINAGQPAATLLQLERLLSTRRLSLDLGCSVVMPSNYTPWSGPGPAEAQQKLFDEAREKVKDIAGSFLRGERKRIDSGPLWQNILFSLIYKMSFRHIQKMDRSFWADERCDGCAVCSKVCPVTNIEMVNEKPAWLHRCEQCFACLQWCPRGAIQYGKKAVKYSRYHHPEVTLKDMLEQANASSRISGTQEIET
jgi:Pyruvate/2-oxoacid:ferredoxin oxidoreductase delta subunit